MVYSIMFYMKLRRRNPHPRLKHRNPKKKDITTIGFVTIRGKRFAAFTVAWCKHQRAILVKTMKVWLEMNEYDFHFL